MPVIVFAYLALGLAVQCLAFTAQPDWTDLGTWMHVLLWPGYLADHAAAWLHGLLAGVSLLDLVVCALILGALAGVRLSRRAAQRTRLTPRAAAPAPASTPRPAAAVVPVEVVEAEAMPAERTRIEPRLSAPAR